jgi:sugar diacid utilization regulator/putative methionine-R-sulfoxide reductase with GAF domain
MTRKQVVPVEIPWIAASTERSLGGLAEDISTWLSHEWSCPVALVRRGPLGDQVLARPTNCDATRSSSDGFGVTSNTVVAGDDKHTTVVPLGNTSYSIVAFGNLEEETVELFALELSCAGFALRATDDAEQTRTLKRELAASHGVATKMLALRDLNQVLLSIANEILALLDADMAGVLLRGDDDELSMRCCVGNLTVETSRLSMARGQGLAGRVLETRRPCKVDQYLKSDSITHDFDPLARTESIRSALGAPLTTHGEVIGVLEVWRRRRVPFNEVDQDRLVALTNLATIAIENARLFDQTHDSLRRLAEAECSLNQQVENLQRAAQVHHTLSALLLDGEGLSAIASAVSKELAADVEIVSPELWRLASRPKDLNIADVRSDISRLTQRTPQGIATRALSNRPGWLTVGSIIVGSEPFGWICVIANEPPTPLTEIVLNSAVLHAALWHLQARAAEQASIDAVDKVLWDILDGSDEHRHAATTRALHMRIDLRKPHRVFVGRLTGLTEYAADQGWDAQQVERFRRSIRARLHRVFREGTGAELVGIRADVVAAVVPDTRNVRELLDALQAGMMSTPEISVRWGVSATRSDPDELGSAHAEARGALHVARRIRGHTATVFDELGLLRFLVGPSDGTDLDRFVNEVIGPLIVADRARNGDLLVTLRGYLEANCSQADAAQRLFVHHKTMRYRLERIKQLTGLDLHLHEDRVRADLALRIHELADPRPQPDAARQQT